MVHWSVPADAWHMSTKQKIRPLKEIFGVNVRLERVRQGLTQEKLGLAMGRDQSYVSQIEKADIPASLDVVDQFAVALGVPRNALFDESLGRRPEPLSRT